MEVKNSISVVKVKIGFKIYGFLRKFKFTSRLLINFPKSRDLKSAL